MWKALQMTFGLDYDIQLSHYRVFGCIVDKNILQGLYAVLLFMYYGFRQQHNKMSFYDIVQHYKMYNHILLMFMK